MWMHRLCLILLCSTIKTGLISEHALYSATDITDGCWTSVLRIYFYCCPAELLPTAVCKCVCFRADSSWFKVSACQISLWGGQQESRPGWLPGPLGEPGGKLEIYGLSRTKRHTSGSFQLVLYPCSYLKRRTEVSIFGVPLFGLEAKPRYNWI